MANEVEQYTGDGFAITKQKMADLQSFVSLTIKGGFAPKGMTVERGVCAIVYGIELGLNPMQSLQQVAVINGRPAMFGDGPLALCLKSGVMEGSPIESFEGKGEDLTAVCTVKRKGSEPATKRFSVAMAKKASLWGKQGPWTQYPSRMLQVRARAMALRDQFADVLAGIHIGEEARDIPDDNHHSKRIELPARGVIGAPERDALLDDSEGNEATWPDKPSDDVAVSEPESFDDGNDASGASAPTESEKATSKAALLVENLIAKCKSSSIDVGEYDKHKPIDIVSLPLDELNQMASDLQEKLNDDASPGQDDAGSNVDRINGLIERAKAKGVDVGEYAGLPFDSFDESDQNKIADEIAARIKAG